MIIYNNNNQKQSHKKVALGIRKSSINKSAKVKTSSSKKQRRKKSKTSKKKGKTLRAPNITFLKSIGLQARKRQHK